MENMLKKAIDFHGHLGPFLVIGMKMGLLALKALDAKNHSVTKVVVETGTKPPVSCIIDGIQVTTGCTIGRGSMEVINNHRPKASFFGEERSLEIELKKGVFERIFEWLKVGSSESAAEMVMELGNMNW